MSRRWIAAMAAAAAAAVMVAGIAAPPSESSRPGAEPPAPGSQPTTQPDPARSHQRRTPRNLDLPLSDQQTAELLKVLRDRRPALLQGLEKLRQTQPDAYRRSLRAAWAWYQKWQDLPPAIQGEAIKAQDEEMAIWRLAGEFHQANDPARKQEIRGEIREAMGRLLDAQHKLQEHRLGKLQEQLERLRDVLRQEQQQREQVVEERVDRWLKATAGRRAAKRLPATTTAAGEQ